MSVNPTAFRRLVREIRQLQTEPPEGIRISTDDEDILDVTGIIQGPAGTPYEGGYFRVKFKFTEEFPAAPPKCWFMTKIFHPNVSKAGEICVNTLKKDWKREYGIGHILVTIKCLLIYPNPESALDEAAGKMLLEKYEDYCKHAKLMTSVHATPKTRPPEFDVPSVIPDSKPAAAATAPAAAPTEQPTATTTTTTSTTTKLAPPTTSTRSVSPGATTRHNTPGATPLVSLNNVNPAAADATAAPTTTKPPSKTSAANGGAVEPLQAATTKASNAGNDQNVDPTAADALAVKVKATTTTTTSSSNAVPSKRSGTGATGGAEKRKKGLKRL
ncbi:hypothetical protein FS837_011803 [Tulasnella sp. UAMH 9824]|nr:hypothetical protein FS837_011803 [Tulasnella sp. UAMH 9824]